ncbi:MAG: transglutaminase-like domain-containing protein, partial [Nanoarchaeota archaeon]|nr:transglutaminase-like domain-containing protein [Nanoarchaeota archaeon]
AEGEDDLFVVVYKTALWTKQNINYNLSTITADVSQPASWVMENREGVCDELTSLFIAMLRSLGIPAKFISGMAYTDLPEFEQKWGGHGWAEVYFPGYGWTDWDVTYGEFGFIDPTHLKLKESVDSDEPATVYVWQGRGIEATAKDMKLSGELIDKFGKIPPRISINASVLYKSVGLGSYNLIEADITNLEDSYLSTILYLAPTENIDIVTDASRIIYLEPRETKKIFWMINIDKNLDTDYVYTFPVNVVSLQNMSSRTAFVAMKGESLFTREQMQQIIDANERERESKAASQLSVSCEADKQFYYGYDTPKISCAVKNIGNTKLNGLNICLEMQCGKTDLKINQEKVFDYQIETLNYGTNPLILSVANEEISKSFIFDILVLDDPKISVKEINAPINVTYKENFTTDFLLERISTSKPINVTTRFTNGGVDEEWSIEEMTNNQRYLIDMTGAVLHIGNNTFNIAVQFTDLNGKEHSTEKSFEIDLVNVTIWQRIAIFWRDIDQRLRKLFK